MSANPVLAMHDWSHADLTERVVQLALAGDTDNFEWHCLDQEVQRRFADDYSDRTSPNGPVGRFRPILVVSVE